MHSTAPGDSWRTWLITGGRGAAADRRRVRGAHRGLKKMLSEGMAPEGDRSRPWNDFSGAMVRQAVNEALTQLPPDHEQVVKLAHFGGLSNREIAERLGLSVAGVQRRLSQALARVSDHIEHGRAAGRRALIGVAAWLGARHLLQTLQRTPMMATDHMIRAAAVAAAGVLAAAALAAPPAPHSGPSAVRTHAGQAARPGAGGTSPAAPILNAAPTVAVPDPDVLAAVPAAVPVTLPVAAPALPTPALPQLPKAP